MGDALLRFFVGGAIVTAFAVVGDVVKPKTFAGIFAAAPSVALASLALAYAKEPESYAATSGRSMIAGAAALFVYSLASARIVLIEHLSPWVGTMLLWVQWLAVALAIRWIALP